MAAYQDIVENIKAFLAASDQSMGDELGEWAREYARLCKEANTRLRFCSDALQHGQRDDAIEIANAAPNLLDLVAMLDLPELDGVRWQQICIQYGLPEPARLLMEEAAALNEAYAEAEPLQELMARHRFLALARAPVRERLEVMRLLAAQDAANAFWDEDVRKCETVRLQEIRTSAAALGRAGDAAGLAALATELQDGNWRVTIAPNLLQAVRQGAAHMHAITRLGELRQMIPLIDEAHAAMDLAQSEALFDQWQAIAADAGANIPPEMQERIESAFQWVAEQREQRATAEAFAAACDDLQQKLDVNALPPALERSYRAACRFPMELPAELRDRYQRRVAERAAALRRKRQLIGAAIAAAFCVAASIVIIITYRSMRSSEVADAVQVLNAAKGDVDAANPDAAERTIHEITAQHSRIITDALVAHAMDELKTAIAAERQREKEFARLLKAATDAGVETPDNGDLLAAGNLAKTDAEKSAVAGLQADIAAYASGQQSKADANLVSRAQSLMNKMDLTLTDDLLQRDPDEYQKQLQSFSDEKQSLSTATGVSSQTLDTEIKTVSAELSQKQAAFDHSANERQMLASVINFAGTAASHQASLKKFIDSCPDSPHSTAFNAELAHIPAEEAVEAWGQLVAPWADQRVPDSAQAASDRVTAIEGYLKTYPDSPFAPGANAYLAYLKQGLAMVAADGPIKKDFCALLSNPLIHDLQIVTDQKGTVYYVLPNQGWKVNPEKMNAQLVGEDFMAITSPDVEKPVQVKLMGDDLLKSDTPSTSPQSQCAATLLTQAADLDFKGWESFGPKALDVVLAQKDLHPVLRGILVENIIQSIQPMLDWACDKADKHVLDQLTAQKIDDLQWLDPQSQPAQNAIDSINSSLKSLTSSADLEQALKRQIQTVCAPLGLQITGECIVVKNGDQVSLSSGPTSQSTVAFILGDGNALTQVARRNGDKWVLDSIAIAQARDGQLVFLGSLPH